MGSKVGFSVASNGLCSCAVRRTTRAAGARGAIPYLVAISAIAVTLGAPLAWAQQANCSEWNVHVWQQMGCSAGTISRICAGELQPPSPQSAYRATDCGGLEQYPPNSGMQCQTPVGQCRLDTPPLPLGGTCQCNAIQGAIPGYVVR
jgi:hypothetical protein